MNAPAVDECEPARDRAREGKANNTRGKAWMRDVARYLREWFPGIDVIADNRRADLSGLTEWAMECKSMQTDRWPETMRQVQRDQLARGARWHVVFKKSYGQPARMGLAVMSIQQWAEIAVILDHLEAKL